MIALLANRSDSKYKHQPDGEGAPRWAARPFSRGSAADRLTNCRCALTCWASSDWLQPSSSNRAGSKARLRLEDLRNIERTLKRVSSASGSDSQRTDRRVSPPP